MTNERILAVCRSNWEYPQLAACLLAVLLAAWLGTGGALFTLPVLTVVAMLVPEVPHAVADMADQEGRRNAVGTVGRTGPAVCGRSRGRDVGLQSAAAPRQHPSR